MTDSRNNVAEGRHYHPIGIFFHWLMAALVFTQLWWGWRMSALAAGADKADAYVFHAQLGVIILIVAMLRGGWRLVAPFIAPQLEKPEDMPDWQHRAAQITHVALYILMFTLPISGLLILGATAPDVLHQALGVRLFEGMSLVERARLEHAAERVHFVSIWMMLLLLLAHIGAAFRHHFIDGDDVLARMIPFLSEDSSSTERASDSARKANATR